jgi:methionyl-tRNA formyltransferase
MSNLRVVFMGTPELARVSLAALLSAPDIQVVGVATQPDRPKGRDLKLQPSPVKALALEAGLPVLQPERAREEPFLGALKQLAPDLIAVAAFGQILPQALLDLPRFGCLNVHTSLLPRYRGAAPIQWAILNGDPETGVTIMKIDVGLDTGDIVSQARTAITQEDTSQTLHDRLAQMGAELLVQTIPGYVSGAVIPRPQPAEGAVHARKIKKEDGRLNWTRPAQELSHWVRGLIPWPGAFTLLPGSQQLLKIWQAEVDSRSGAPGTILEAAKSGIVVACGSQSLRIQTLQREGGKRLSARDFLAGHPLSAGSHFE